MKIFQRCPGTTALQQFLDEETSDGEARSIGRHIESCQRCQEILDQLTTQDPLARESGSSLGNEHEPSLHSLVQRLQTEKSPFDTQDSTATRRNVPRKLQAPIVFPPESGEGIPVNHYRLVEVVGSGASGVVYKAIDSKLDRTVAIKLLRGELVADDHSIARLEREAKSVAALSHPNVLSVFELGEREIDNGGVGLNRPVSYLVTEYVDGQSLAERLEQEGSLPIRWVAKMVQSIGAGLHAAHEAGLIHRDIKPSNILIANKDDQPKIADFGLAIDDQFRSRLTHEGMIAGTPAYMSPEQIQSSDQLDRRADVYSLGVLLYECLTGDVPFRGIAKATIDRVLHEQPRDPRILNPEIPKDLSSICLKAISKEPTRRYQTAEAFAQDIGRWLNGQPVQARPVSRFEKFSFWVRHNPVTAQLAIVASTLTIALLIGSVLFAINLASTNRLTKKALDRELAQSQLIGRQRDALLNTVQNLVYQVNDDLEYQGDTDIIQKRLLDIALGGLKSAIETADESEFDRHVADIHLRLGMVLYRLDETANSRDHLRKANSIAKRMRNTYPDDVNLQKLLTRIQWWSGQVEFDEGNRNDAERHWRSALENSELLHTQTLDDIAFIDDVTNGKIRYAELQLEEENYSHAKKLLRSALDLTERLEYLADATELETVVIDPLLTADYLRLQALATMANVFYAEGDHEKTAEYDYKLTSHFAYLEPYDLVLDIDPGFWDSEYAIDESANPITYWQQSLGYLEQNYPSENEMLVEKATCNRMLAELFLQREQFVEAIPCAIDAVEMYSTLSKKSNRNVDHDQLAIVTRVKYSALLKLTGQDQAADQQIELVEQLLKDLVRKYGDDEDFDVFRWRRRLEFEIDEMEDLLH